MSKSKKRREVDLDHRIHEQNELHPPADTTEMTSFSFEQMSHNDGIALSEDILEDQRQIFSRLYDLAPVSYFILDILGVIEEVNKTGTALFGYSKLTMLNKRFHDFVLKEDLDDFNFFLQDMHEGNIKKSMEIKLMLPDGKIIFAHLEGIVVRGTHSKTQYYLAAIDITENRQAELELKEIKNMLEMTLKACATGTWSIKKGTNRLIFDEYSHEILDLPASSFQGTWEDSVKYIHPAEKARILETVLNAITTSSPIDIEFQIITEKGCKKDIHSKGHHILLYENEVLFAGIIMDITAKKDLLRKAEAIKYNQQKKILAATLAAQESERNNISRTLHDSVCQLLYGIKLNLQSLPLSESKRELERINKLLDLSIKETRDISYTLTPSVLNDYGFVAGIKEMSERLSTDSFKISSFVSSSLDKLKPTIQLYLFRIIQELVNNCIKHAAASKVLIVAKEEAEKIKIIVADNGKGFRSSTVEKFRNGTGLRSIKSQVFLLNGELTFKTAKNKMTICLTFDKHIELLKSNS